MVAAMKAVRNGTAVKRAAVDHGVPWSTLQDRISGRVVHGNSSGPTCLEARWHEFLQAVDQVGYPKTRREMKGITQAVASEKGLLKRSRILTSGFESLWSGNHIYLFVTVTVHRES